MIVYVNKYEYDVITEDRFEEMVKEAVDERIESSADFWDDCKEEATNAEYDFPAELFYDIEIDGWITVHERIEKIAYDLAIDQVREEFEDCWIEKIIWGTEDV